jgi:hypothetical protein
MMGTLLVILAMLMVPGQGVAEAEIQNILCTSKLNNIEINLLPISMVGTNVKNAVFSAWSSHFFAFGVYFDDDWWMPFNIRK